MAFVKKTDSSQGEVFKFDTVGTSITGVYLGSFDHEGDYGPTKKHTFKTEKGVKVTFGQRHLTDLLASENPGALVRITYTADKKMKSGRPMKMFSLEIDDEYVASADEVANSIPSYEDESDDLADVVVEPTPVAKSKLSGSATTASRQAEIQAKLANRTRAS